MLSISLSVSLCLFSRDALTPLSRSRLSSGELIVGGAYSWSSITPTCRAKGEHLCYTTGTLISENSSALLCVSLEAREEKSKRERCKFKLANFLMEIAVTPEWACLELKYCCNQYRLSWGWRAKTFRSPFVGNNGEDCLLFFPDMPQTSRYGRGIAGYDAGSGKQIQRRAFYQEANSRALFEAAGSSQVTGVLGLRLTSSS